MYTSITIERLRGIENLTVGGLGRVNLIVGKNGSGKTTLLEAMHLISGGSDPLSPAHCVRMRSRGPILGLPLLALFPGGQATSSVVLLASWQGEANPRHLEIRLVQANAVEIGGSAPSGDAVQRDFIGELQMTYTLAGGAQLKTTAAVHLDRLEGQKRNRPDAHPVAHLSARASTEEIDIGLLSALIREKQLHVIVRQLKVVEPSLRELAVIVDMGNAAIIADLGIGSMLPLSALGNGLERTLAMLLPMPACTGGILLVDEIEAGLHYSVYPKLWELLDRSCRDLQIQLFATTHSDEFLRCGLEYFKKSEDGAFTVVRMDRLKNGSHRATRYDHEMQTALLEVPFEVRG